MAICPAHCSSSSGLRRDGFWGSRSGRRTPEYARSGPAARQSSPDQPARHAPTRVYRTIHAVSPARSVTGLASIRFLPPPGVRFATSRNHSTRGLVRGIAPITVLWVVEKKPSCTPDWPLAPGEPRCQLTGCGTPLTIAPGSPGFHHCPHQVAGAPPERPLPRDGTTRSGVAPRSSAGRPSGSAQRSFWQRSVGRTDLGAASTDACPSRWKIRCSR